MKRVDEADFAHWCNEGPYGKARGNRFWTPLSGEANHILGHCQIEQGHPSGPKSSVRRAALDEFRLAPLGDGSLGQAKPMLTMMEYGWLLTLFAC